MGDTANFRTYIGDGVYAEDDGFGIWLTTKRENGTHRIYLEPMVLAALNEWWIVTRLAPRARARVDAGATRCRVRAPRDGNMVGRPWRASGRTPDTAQGRAPY